MKTATQTEPKTTVAARVAGEDISCGDYVAVLHELIELPSFFWSCSDVTLAPDELVRIRFMPSDAGHPYKVTGVCLPFVYVKDPAGRVVVVDTRQRQLVRLDRGTARQVWRKLKSPSSKRCK
ncbi:MAG: hypothetical protein R3E01_01715 [Pirellulaceae bacterium]